MTDYQPTALTPQAYEQLVADLAEARCQPATALTADERRRIGDCPCPHRWGSLGTLYGISMGHGWIRTETDPTCPEHAPPDLVTQGDDLAAHYPEVAGR